jgi:hypothetical protein
VRTTNDLIAELQAEARGAVTAALIVGFETTTLLLEAGENDPVGMLEEMIQAGGEPVGIMRVTNGTDGSSVSFRPLAEYSDDEQIQMFLRKLSETCVRHFGSGKESELSPCDTPRAD